MKRNIDDWIFNENHHKPIISIKIFKEAQIILDNKQKTKFNDSKDILSGYFKCFDCNSTMYLKKGKNKEYYYCKNYLRNKLCSNHLIEKEKLYEDIINIINQKNFDNIKLKKLTRNVVIKYIDCIYILEDKTINVIMKNEKK